VLANVLHTRSEVRVLNAENGPPHVGYRSDVVEVFETYGYRPAYRLIMTIVGLAKRLQSGRLDAYLLYMLIVLIAVIAIVTAMA
jgi:hydrogenase-4 component B